MTADAQPTLDTSPAPLAGFQWRRLFQYRLRTLLIVTAIIAVWFGWWSYKARQQREAVAALTRIRADIGYDFEGRHLDGPSHWPAWLVDLVGLDYFAKVVRVGFPGYIHYRPKVTDDDLEHLESLTSLKEIVLIRAKVTDVGLAHLKGLTKLQRLNLYGTDVTDAGLEHFEGLVALQWLDLSHTEVTDTGLAHLQGLNSLVELYLYNTHVTDAGVARLQKSLPNCKIEHWQP
ncbi:MAG: hypothetical protein K8T25_08340 [Planctomycetia bacterium]|nr:hypothetical protein [Planctomycetia bacterium]